MSGSGASNARTNKIHSLLVACTGDEAKYLVRGLNGTLRVGQYLSTSLFSATYNPTNIQITSHLSSSTPMPNGTES